MRGNIRNTSKWRKLLYLKKFNKTDPKSSHNEPKTGYKPWELVAIEYYFNFGSQYDKDRFEKLQKTLTKQGYRVDLWELINYITNLKDSEALIRKDNAEKERVQRELEQRQERERQEKERVQRELEQRREREKRGKQEKKRKSGTNKSKRDYKPWEFYATEYYDKYGAQYDQERFKDLHNFLIERGYQVHLQELINYITNLNDSATEKNKEKMQLNHFDDDSWKNFVDSYHNAHANPYNEFIYSELLGRLHKNHYQITYKELVEYIATLGKSEALIKIENAEKERIRKEREKIRKEKQDLKKFQEGPHFHLIVGFTEKLGEGYSGKDLKLLTNIINSKGYKLSQTAVIPLINEELENQAKSKEYDQFVKKITYNNPDGFDSYLENFYNFYSIENEEDVEFFLLILSNAEINMTEEELIDRFEQFEIKKFEKMLLNENAKQKTSIQEIDKMSGPQFENFLFNLFRDQGYEVIHTPYSCDQGADLIIKGFGEIIAIQAKCYTNQNIGNSAVQEIVPAIKYYEADRGIVVTNTDFSQSAIDLARANDVTLINRKELLKWLESDFRNLS